MRLIPNSMSLHEANDCHHPAGSPQGGQFCSDGKSNPGHYETANSSGTLTGLLRKAPKWATHVTVYWEQYRSPDDRDRTGWYAKAWHKTEAAARKEHSAFAAHVAKMRDRRNFSDIDDVRVEKVR